ncbi:hypothetical protein Tco_1308380, partial [Tanacetum coccineum]
MVTESLEELKKILINKIDKSESCLEAPKHKECYEGLIKSYDLDKTLFSTYGRVYSLKRSQKDKDKDEDPSVESDRGLKKRKTNKDAEPTKGLKTKESKSSSSKVTKSQPKSSGKSVQEEEPEFEVADSDMPQDQEGNLGNDDEEPTKKVASKQCYKALSEKLDWENSEGDDYPFDLTKPLLLVMSGNRQKVLVDYFFNNDLKYLQGGISTITYTTSTTKMKAAQYDLPGIEDMVLNIWSHVKVSYDKHALLGISHWREQRKTFYGYARGLQSTHDVYSMKRILAITHVKVMRKHGYGYLKEIVNRLTNLSGDDVYDFTIALRMFTKSLVIQKRVKDLQLGVERYQKKINITKPETTRPDLRIRHPYTPYQDPQGFIYVDNQERNMLMRSDELYKFSDGTLTRLLTLLEDIKKNIHMEYLPKRRWSSLEKKRAHIMIK